MKTYIILGGIVNGDIGNDVPRIHERKIETSKDLISVEVEEGGVPHHKRNRASTMIQSRSAMRRHIDVKQGNC